MVRVLVLAAVLGACAPDVDYEQTDIELATVSPPMGGGGEDVFAAAGPILMTRAHITKDGGVSWGENNAAILPTTAIAVNAQQLVVQTTVFGWGRWDMTTDQVVAINPPAGASVSHARASTATIFAPISSAMQIARQTANGHWDQVTLPNPPSPPAVMFAVNGIGSNATTVIATTTWGIYRSGDDGATWTFADPLAVPAGSVMAFPDGRFMVFSGADQTGHMLDATGVPTGMSTPSFPVDARVQCLGAIITGEKYTTDFGMTFQPLIPGATFAQLKVNSFTCAGDKLWVHISMPTPMIVPLTTLGGAVGAPLVYAPAPQMPSASTAVFASDGTVLAANLAWKPGDAAWSVRVTPQVPLYALADGSLLGAQGTTLYRSKDGGVTWDTSTVATLPKATHFFATPDHLLWASAGGATGSGWTSQLWKSEDDGATWTQVFEKTSPPDMAPMLVAIAADGTFVAKAFATGLYVSHDRGATWTDLPFPTGYSLAFITHAGDAVTFDPADDNALGNAWHVWHDYGLGNAYRQVQPTMGGMRVEVGASGTAAFLDASDRPFLFGGGSTVSVFRGDGTL